MANLEKRIEALEAAAGDADGLTVIILRGIAPGHLDAEIDTLKIPDGLTTWRRRPEETEQTFKDRAIREAPRNEAGVTLLLANG